MTNGRHFPTRQSIQTSPIVPQPASGFARLPAVPLMTILSPGGLQIKPRPFTRPSLVLPQSGISLNLNYWVYTGYLLGEDLGPREQNVS